MGCAFSSGGGGNDSKGDDSNHPDNKKSFHEGWESIKEKKRGCTDLLCLLLLWLSWAATTVVGLIALGVITDPHLPKGDPLRLASPLDYDGRICGYDTGVLSRPYGYYLLDRTAVCVSSCPKASNYTSFICKDIYQQKADKNIAVAYMYVTMQRCMYKLQTKSVINRCVPDVVVSAATSAAGDAASKYGKNVTNSSYQTQSDPSWFQSFLADVWSIRGLLFGFGLGFSTIVAFSYTYFLRLPGLLFFLIWGILIAVLGSLLAGAVLLFLMSQDWKTDGVHSLLSSQIAEYTSYGVFCICGLYLCLLIVIRSRVQLAIGVIKEAAKALATMPLLIVMPIIQAIGMIFFLVPWTIYVFYLASSGEVVQKVGTYTSATGISYSYNYRQFEYADNTKYAFLYMLFSWFWTSEFIIAYGQLSIAFAVTCWYFTRSEHKWKIGSWTVIWAMMTVGFYHTGTAAFGSLLIAIVKTIQAVLAYLQKQAKKANNRLLQYLLCIVQCCMWCFEKFMRFMNKRAYIQTAIYGYSFCKAARSAFFLIMRNILRVMAVGIVADFVLLLGKLFVPSLTTLIVYVIIKYTQFGNEIHDVVSPCVFVFLMAYLVSAMFAEIFSMTIDTILCCYVADEEMFPLEKRFADGGLKSALQRTAQKHASKKATPEEKYAPSASTATVEEPGQPSNATLSKTEAPSPGQKVVINVHQVSHPHHHHPEGEILL